MANRSELDGAHTKVRLLMACKPGESHPTMFGTDGMQRYFKMTEECAAASRMKALGQASLSP